MKFVFLMSSLIVMAAFNIAHAEDERIILDCEGTSLVASSYAGDPSVEYDGTTFHTSKSGRPGPHDVETFNSSEIVFNIADKKPYDENIYVSYTLNRYTGVLTTKNYRIDRSFSLNCIKLDKPKF